MDTSTKENFAIINHESRDRYSVWDEWHSLRHAHGFIIYRLDGKLEWFSDSQWRCNVLRHMREQSLRDKKYMVYETK